MYDEINNSYENSDGLITNGCVNVQKAKLNILKVLLNVLVNIMVAFIVLMAYVFTM